MKLPDVETAVRIYHENTEIGSAEIVELFGGKLSSSTVCRLKDEVRKVQIERNVKTWSSYSVNTKIAYEVWHLDIDDLEKRLAKLQKLGFLNKAS